MAHSALGPVRRANMKPVAWGIISTANIGVAKVPDIEMAPPPVWVKPSFSSAGALSKTVSPSLKVPK